MDTTETTIDTTIPAAPIADTKAPIAPAPFARPHGGQHCRSSDAHSEDRGDDRSLPHGTHSTRRR